MKKNTFITTLILFLAFSSNAKAAVLDFDSINVYSSSGYTTNLNNYGGFSWINFGVLDAKKYNYPKYLSSMSSESQVAYNVNAVSPSEIIFNQVIDLEKAHFGSAYFEPNNITISGTYATGGNFNKTFTLYTSTTEPNGQWVDFNLQGITSLKFEADNYYFGMDDLTYTPVPEPSSMALGLMSLAGLLGARRKKK